MKWTYLGAIAVLIPLSIRDARKRTIPARWLMIGAVLAIAAAGGDVYIGAAGIWDKIAATVPGLCLLALSIITEKQIGAGDGICAILLGLVTGVPAIYVVLSAALFFSSGYAALLIATRRGSRKSTMPWIPFMLAGMVALMAVQGVFV